MVDPEKLEEKAELANFGLSEDEKSFLAKHSDALAKFLKKCLKTKSTDPQHFAIKTEECLRYEKKLKEFVILYSFFILALGFLASGFGYVVFVPFIREDKLGLMVAGCWLGCMVAAIVLMLVQSYGAKTYNKIGTALWFGRAKLALLSNEHEEHIKQLQQGFTMAAVKAFSEVTLTEEENELLFNSQKFFSCVSPLTKFSDNSGAGVELVLRRRGNEWTPSISSPF